MISAYPTDTLLPFRGFILERPYVASAILCLTLLLGHELISSRKRRPPRVRYSLPWIGSAFEMGKDPDAFFERASSELGPIFRVKALGQDMTYITSPELISTLYRDVKTYEFTPIRVEVSEKIFGLSRAALESPYMVDVYYPMHHRGLSPKNVVGLLQRYTESARECVLSAVDKFDGCATPLVPFLVPPAYFSATRTFWGKGFDTESSYKPFRTFDNQFHLMLAGVPRFMMPNPHRAWDQVVKLFEQYLESPHQDSSEFILEIEAGGKEGGWSARDLAKVMASELWALQANAVYAAYWVIALELQKPEGLAGLVAEIDRARRDWQARHPDESLATNKDQWLLKAPLPLLTSTIQEALRVSTSTFSIRRVSRPVEFAGYQFETGDRIICETRAVHLDSEIHPNPHEFNSERYMDSQNKFTKNGKIVPNHSMPFGGGVSMCEGRHFATGELKIYVALLLSYVTIELDPNSTSRPKPLAARIGVGVMPPVGDLNVKISRRNVIL